MFTKRVFIAFLMFNMFILSCTDLICDLYATESGNLSISRLYSEIESLGLSKRGYILAAELTKLQKKIANENMLESSTQGTFKFKDNELTIVADIKTDRVLLIMESIDDASQPTVQTLVGSLFMAYDEPTVLAHDKIVYWAYGTKGKVSSLDFESAKEKQENLRIIATVKLQSEINIMGKEEASTEQLTGNVYYIISSEALLKYFL